MALSAAEQATLRALIAREGLSTFQDELKDLDIGVKKAAALSALNAAITVSVSDWKALGDHVASATGAVLPSLIADIAAAQASKSTTNLGALLWQHYAASKAHLGL